LLTTTACVAQGASSAPAVLKIQADHTLYPVSPMLYGMMTEEINFSYDGGLYAELVKNRTLRDRDWNQQDWLIVQNASAGAKFEQDKSTGPSEALTDSIKLTVSSATEQEPAGLRNMGYWGYPLKPNTTYKFSVWAKADGSLSPLHVNLVNNKSNKSVASAEVTGIGSEWKQYTATLKTGAIEASEANHLELTLTKPGTVWIDLVSVMPPTYHDRPNGTRIDLMEKLAGLHPAFLRFPGGNYLEGDHINERYEWKKTIGRQVDRPTHPSPWNYHSSDGFGLLEFLEWCEDLKMKPVLAVYGGYSMKQEHVEPGKDLEPYVQDALEELEYVTGDASTKWGAQRVKDGHPEPFKLEYVEVGNEDWFDKSKSYDGRYKQFYEAIKAKYPSVQIIATAPITSMKPDILDDHFYLSAEKYFDDIHHYDKFDRNGPKIFMGEYATMEGSPTGDFGAALGDAAWLTGVERNTDVVVMSSYAPLLVNVHNGGMQWHPDLIGYDGLTSYGSPSYYVLSLFAGNVGNVVPESSLTGAGPRVAYSVTKKDADRTIFLKIVNGVPTAQELEIDLAGVGAISGSIKVKRLHALSPADTNTITDPRHIIPVESTLAATGAKIKHRLDGYTFEVLEIHTKK
ncbi:MAG TPA: alpha-L-arabinofuranosidase C-terminal domain-containing protein, partial [Acidobacteriaceae bacterium]